MLRYRTSRILLLLTPLALVSCGAKASGSDSLISSSISSATPSYLKSGISAEAMKLSETTEYQGQIPMASTGTLKPLVVPVEMGGERSFTPAELQRIKDVFFGDSLSSKSDTNYFSLAEYYHRTSLGKLTITGQVSDVLKCTEKVSDLEADSSYVPGIPAYYVRQNNTADLLNSFATAKDGYVDGVCFIYSAAFTSSDAYYWAFTNTFAKQSGTDKPSLGRHIWMSINFLQSTGYANDGHTIIHEFGHMLGLRDYYPSDNAYLPLGGMSMMDYNILDHDPYSKMMLNWAEPQYYQLPSGAKTTITLKPFETSNQVILLNDTWDHSALDEYLLLEYYTPTELNALDSKKQYIATTAQRPIGFQKAGIKIYHVDSRVAKLLLDSTTSTYSFASYVETIPSTIESGTLYQIGANNTDKYSYTDARRQGRFKQVGLVENKTVNNLQNGATADDDSLFHEGDTFDSSDSIYLPNGLFNDKTAIGYRISVGSLQGDGATIT